MARGKSLLRSKGEDRRGQLTDLLSIHLRPPDVTDRHFPGHWVADLIKSKNNASAVGALVERAARLLMMVKMPHPQPATTGSCVASLYRQAQFNSATYEQDTCICQRA